MATPKVASPAASSLLQTAVNYGDACGLVSLQSESERSTMSSISAAFKRRSCICSIGDACQIMSTAYNSVKDPRGCFVLIPSYEVQLREAYCRHLRPDATSEEIDNIDEFCVAVHHFHPTLIDKCLKTGAEDRQEDYVLPMPDRTIKTDSKSKALEMLLDEKDLVVNHQTGAPLKTSKKKKGGGREYWVVPSYSFDAAHADLKQSMKGMPQLKLERCVRRMKREARRQKWEGIVNKWEAVSKRSSIASEASMTRATDALTVPQSPSSSQVSSTSSILQPPTNLILQHHQAVSPPRSAEFHRMEDLQNQFDIELDSSRGGGGGVKLHGLSIVKQHERPSREEDDDSAIRRGSMMTAQEVLESELNMMPDDDDEDSVLTDLATVDEPAEDEPQLMQQLEAERNAEENSPPADDGSCASERKLMQEVNATRKLINKLEAERKEEKDTKPNLVPASPTSVVSQKRQQQPDEGSMSSLSNEESSVVKASSSSNTETAATAKPKEVDPRHAEMRKALDALRNQQEKAQKKSDDDVVQPATKPSEQKVEVPSLKNQPTKAPKPLVVDPHHDGGIPEAITTSVPITSKQEQIAIDASKWIQENAASIMPTSKEDLQQKLSFAVEKLKEIPESKPYTFMKSRNGVAVAVALYCVFIVRVVVCVSHCRSVLRTREEAFV